MNHPLVTVRTITYNHEPYIRQCLEGLVMQQTNFKFECIVHDDASTDGTSAIIREFAEKYPHIIKPIYQSENQYSKGYYRIIKILKENTKGKYVAVCEGDDYWTDPLKLQKQVDFLEANPDYSMCFHPVNHTDSNDEPLDLDYYSHLREQDYGAADILARWTVPTCSCVHRREVLDVRPHNPNFKMGDNVLFLSCTLVGKLHCINEKMGVYRIVPTGAGAKLNHHVMLAHWEAMHESFPTYRELLDKNIISVNISLLFHDRGLPNKWKWYTKLIKRYSCLRAHREITKRIIAIIKKHL